jgi:hypothetical protein
MPERISEDGRFAIGDNGIPVPTWGGHSIVTPQQVDAARQAESDRVNAAIRARQQRDAEREAERQAAREAEGQARLAAYEEEARQRFVNNGGTPADFARAWPKIKEQWLTERAASDPREAYIASEVERLRGRGPYTRF